MSLPMQPRWNGGAVGGVRLTGLLGYPVGHSLSPAMHNAAFACCGLDDWLYVLVPTPPDRFDRHVRTLMEAGFAGWNVTVPHKQRMLAYLHEMSDEVRAVGACNTVRVQDGRLVGFNTDVVGFMEGMVAAGSIAPGAGAVVLGAGGAARAVAYALASAGHSVLVLARRPQQAAELAGALAPFVPVPVRHDRLERSILEAGLADAQLLVNCTPAGMWPHEHQPPLPAGTRLPAHLLVYDLIYTPRRTRLLRQAHAAGCRTQDGLEMLVRQGAAAFHIWTACPPPVAVMRQAVAHLSL